MSVMIAAVSTEPTGGAVLKSGEAVTFTLTASAAVEVAAGSGGELPELVLSNNRRAIYDAAASGGTRLVFTYTVGAGQDTSDLDITGLNPNGATITGTGGTSTGGMAFQQPATHVVGSQPLGIVATDLSGDGKPDIAVANGGSGSVSVLLGDGQGGFGPRADYASTAQTYSGYTLTAADVNGDGFPDLAVSGTADDAIRVLINDGRGGFAAAISYPAGSSPVAAADLNGDGGLDLVVSDTSNGTVSVLLNDPSLNAGQGGFAAAVSYPAGPGPGDLAMADLNGDGRSDLAVANVDSGSVSVLLGDGQGGFGAPIVHTTGATPYDMAAADLNGDGWLDLVVVNRADGTVSVLLNDPALDGGRGGFAPHTTHAVGGTPTGVAVADVDGDGEPDVVVANRADDTLSVLLGDGRGGFAPQATYATPDGPGQVVVADLNGDGTLDPVAADISDGTVSVLLNDSTTRGQALDASALPGLPGSDTGLVIDTTAPVLDVGAAPTGDIEATSARGAAVSFAAVTATDAVDGAPTLTYTDENGHPVTSGQTFGSGAHTITVTATDDAGNRSTETFGFRIVGTTSPTPTESTVTQDGVIAGIGDTITYTLTADEAVTVTGTPGLTLANGRTAAYTGGTGTGTGTGTDTLTFTHALRAGDTAGGLDIVAPVLDLSGGAAIRDAAGNGIAATGAAGTPSGVPSLDTETPVPTVALSDDTGMSATDRVTSTAALTGAAEANGVVRVRVDGGPAVEVDTGARGTWTYTPTGLADGEHTVTVTQTDPAGNTGTTQLAFTLDTTAPAPARLFRDGHTPGVVDWRDPAPVELGVRFRASTAGAITGIRFYKGSRDTGTHVVDLWGADATLLARVPSTGESASGWQWVAFAAPVRIEADTIYVAAYHNDAGYYSATTDYFTTDHISGPLTAPAVGNGVFGYGAPAFPTGTFKALNYWVDVVFDPVALLRDTGASASDGVTSDATLAGVVDPGGTIEVFEGTNRLGAAAVDDAGRWTFAPQGLTAGAHTVTVSMTDPAGNTGTSDVAFTLDGADPVLDVSAAPTGDIEATSADGAAVSFAATATDAVDGAPTLTYTDADGDTVRSGDVFAVGTHAITVTATDDAGNRSTETFCFRIVDAAPVVTVTTRPPATVEATSPAGAAVGFAAAASDAVDGALTVAYTENGRPVAPGDVFALGAHTIVATATDARGQDSTHDIAFTVADLTAPVVTVASAPTTPVEATSPAGAAVGFAATASDAVDGAPTLTYTENGRPVAPGDVFGLGEHTVIATATDAAGNRSTGRFTFAVVDTTAPALTATQSVSGLTNATTATITGTVSDLDGVQTVEVYDGDTKLGEAVVTDGAWSYAASGLSDGEHGFTARATDGAGNATSRVSAGAAVIVDTTAPQTFTAAESVSGLTARTALTLSGTVSDTNGIAGVELYDTFGGARPPVFLGTATLDGTAWTYDVTGLGDGVHGFAAIAIDSAGNASPVPVSTGAGVTVDTTAPDVPVVSGLVVSGLGARPGAGGVAVRGTAEAGSTVAVYRNAAPLGTVTAGSDGTWAVPLTGALQAGAHAFTATAADAVGNLSSASSAAIVTVVEPPPAGARPRAVVFDTGARGAAVTRTETGDLVVTRNGVTQVLRGVDEVRFTDGRLVFDPQDTASAVSRLYRAGLGRELDQGGLDHWGKAIEGGARLSDLARAFLDSPEGQALYGMESPDGGFVARLYRNVLGRPGDPEGVAFWTRRLGEGASRAEVLAALADGGENRQATASQGVWDLDEGAAQAARFYGAAFGRLPDQNGLTYWAEVINTGRATPQGVAQGFMASPEFQTLYGSPSDTDFVRALHQNTFDRAGDAAGMDHWTERLGAGLSRAALLVWFSESPEHVARTAADIMGGAPGQFGIKLA